MNEFWSYDIWSFCLYIRLLLFGCDSLVCNFDMDKLEIIRIIPAKLGFIWICIKCDI